MKTDFEICFNKSISQYCTEKGFNPDNPESGIFQRIAWDYKIIDSLILPPLYSVLQDLHNYMQEKALKAERKRIAGELRSKLRWDAYFDEEKHKVQIHSTGNEYGNLIMASDIDAIIKELVA